jgi:hypothetical protein
MRFLHGVKTRSGLFCLLLGVVLVHFAINQLPTAYACGTCSDSTSGALTLSPASGPIGTIVTVQLDVIITTPETYTFTFTTSDPTTTVAACVNGQQIASVTPVQMQADVESGVSYTRLRWPAGLGPGKYWLCAVPKNTNRPVLPSKQPFTVVAGTLPSPAVQVDTSSTQPGYGTLPGDMIKVSISNWYTMDNSSPRLYLLPRGASPAHMIDLPYNAQFSKEGSDLSTYQIDISLPGTLAPGAYAVIAVGECTDGTCALQAQSLFFMVTAIHPPRQAPSANNDGPLTTLVQLHSPLVEISLGALALILLLLLLTPFFRRKRAGGSSRV